VDAPIESPVAEGGVIVAQTIRTARERPWAVAGVALALLVIVAGKTYYREATAGELTWILAPTAKLVSWISGGSFVYEAGPGWVDPQIGFIIAAPCAGVNFALAAFLALGVGGAPGMVSARTLAARLAVAAALAYVATLVVNTARIAIAIAMHRGTIDIAGDRAELHRIEGIVVYLGGLVGLYALARALDGRRRHVIAG
jgi:exosortase K